MSELLSYLKIKRVDLEKYTKVFLTLKLGDIYDINKINELLKSFYQYIKNEKIQIVYEKHFGNVNFINNSDSIFSESPKSVLAYKTNNDLYASVSVYGIISNNDEIKISYLEDSSENKKIGTIVSSNHFRYAYLIGISDNTNNHNRLYDRFSDVWLLINSLLDENDFKVKDLVRTWIYLKDINNSYPEFNSSRNDFFNQVGIDFSSDSNLLPASTCIGSMLDGDKNISIDLLCIDARMPYPVRKRIYNSLQNEAEGENYLFKPSFSRGMLLEDLEHKEIQISGTASVNKSGKTIFIDDCAKQFDQTLKNMNQLLSINNMSFSDIVESTCFFKNLNYQKKLNREIPEDVSDTIVEADVCRDNLLTEIDGIAIKIKNYEKRN